MNRAPVSVIIPYYNGQAFIGRAVASLESQTLPPSEIILVDDGSADPPVIDEASIPLRIITHPSNEGIAFARNSGAEAATQPWLAFLDQDDEWLPNKLQLQWQAVKAAGDAARNTMFYGRCWRSLAGVAGGDEIAWPRPAVARRLDRSPPDALRELALRGNAIPLITVLFAKDAWERIGGFDEWLTGGSDDYAMMLRMAGEGTRFHCVCAETPIARRHETGFNHSDALRFLEDDVLLLNAIAADLPVTRPYLRRSLAAAHYRAGRALLEADPATALRLLRAALELWPVYPRALATAAAALVPQSTRKGFSDCWTRVRRFSYRVRPGMTEPTPPAPPSARSTHLR